MPGILPIAVGDFSYLARPKLGLKDRRTVPCHHMRTPDFPHYPAAFGLVLVLVEVIAVAVTEGRCRSHGEIRE